MFHGLALLVVGLTLSHLFLALPLVGMAVGVFTHSITKGYKSDEGTITSVVTSITGNGECGLEDTLAVGATNTHYTIAVTISQIKAMVLYASTSMTVKTNSSTTPQETISLAAGQQIVYEGSGASGPALPFSGNITGLYVTNNDPKAGNFKFRAVLAE